MGNHEVTCQGQHLSWSAKSSQIFLSTSQTKHLYVANACGYEMKLIKTELDNFKAHLEPEPGKPRFVTCTLSLFDNLNLNLYNF